MLNQECSTVDVTQLAAQARAAYEQKRTKECLVLTRQLMQADPGNEDARTLESAIRADIGHDLRDARGLLEHSGTQEESKKYRKAAEIILLKTLYLDPDNREANALLQTARMTVQMTPGAARKAEDVPFTAVPIVVKKAEKKRGKLPIALLAVIVIGAGLLVKLQSRPHAPAPAPAPVVRTEPPPQPGFPGFQPRGTNPITLAPVKTDPRPATDTRPAPPPLTRIETAPVSVTAVPEMGKLAVSSPMAAEIYMADRYLGSTPTTLQLPVGHQTLEYRHGNLRSVLTHDIRANETTAASVTFPVTVQINAKPWAQVFVDDGTRRPLGQTPLSGVTVPVGAVLIFENPGFSSKSYRIAEKDTAVQVNFP